MSVLRLDLREGDDWRQLPLTADQAGLVSRSEIADIRPADEGWWELRARTKVGAALIGSDGGTQIDLRIMLTAPSF